MTYPSLKDCILDLEKNGHLIRIKDEVDPDLEMAEIHRRIFQAGGPAIFYEKVKGSPFPAVSNLFGTLDRARFIFRDTLENVKKLVQVKADPTYLLRNPSNLFSLPFTAAHALPRKVSGGPVLECQTTLDQLPQIKCWPQDGGAFILLPQVYTEDPDQPGISHSNLGMYRIQLSGNQYEPNRQAGLHYQIRRDIGIHHTNALRRGEKLRVSIFIGGPPAHTFSAVMYLPEGLSEIHFAGALAGRGFRYTIRNGFVISTDTDFCITGYMDPAKTLPEGPFGDHLGYYSLEHAFPFLEVESVYHRKDAVWPFTVVGRPPQEDSVFGKLIQEIAGPMIPKEIPGVKAVHAVDDCGVHPLLLAIGSERYTPYQLEKRPQEILTNANALLGYGPCSLAKYLIIAAGEDDPGLDIHNVPAFFQHCLERVDFTRDLHFQTATTIDTLDYSGTGLNQGSKVVITAAGKKIRELSQTLPEGLKLPEGFENPKIVTPGIAVIQAPKFVHYSTEAARVNQLCKIWQEKNWGDELPLLVLVDDADFSSAPFSNFLWVTFTRSNPSHDIYGVGSFQEFKHWGCEGPLVIDARIKPHHAPPLIEDPAIQKKVDTFKDRIYNTETLK
ncbi:MAG: UbiD family decarboxylase [Candidatus Omnitrophica bacterium]|nr:UbiD family decarboxylase [Candidatus Omnitrophota bacterium]